MIDFSNTQIAFADKSDKELNRAYWIFRVLNNTFLAKVLTQLTLIALAVKLPIRKLIRKTVFAHFCGGETLEEAKENILQLSRSNIKTIFDYAVEGSSEYSAEQRYDKTTEAIINMIDFSKTIEPVAFIAVKMTGIARKELLEKASKKNPLTEKENEELKRVKDRLYQLCKAAYAADKYINIDAEETWLQPVLDEFILDMMRQFNNTKPIVSNTYQMYVCNKISTIKEHYTLSKKENFYLGVKLVRGAYLEKERKIAAKNKEPSPVYDTKNETDTAFDNAIKFCLQDIEHISLCVASHNENSCLLAAQLMEQKGIKKNHHNVWFAQLLGMSDHISYNLAYHGYNVAKYVPYGPILSTIPYLIRRAEENTSIAGQMGRELKNIIIEKQRRRTLAKSVKYTEKNLIFW
jgi:proline dehydrogenase